MENQSDSSDQRRLQGEVLETIFDTKGFEKCCWEGFCEDFEIRGVWTTINPDGIYKNKTTKEYIIVECYMHIGPLKAGHKGKIAKDVLKMISAKNAAKKNQDKIRLVLVVPDTMIFSGSPDLKGWFSEAVESLVEIMRIELNETQCKILIKAQRRAAAAFQPA